MFHTICTFLSVIGKRFQDAGLRDVIIESGVIPEGSVFGVRTYNRAIRSHKLMYEAMRFFYGQNIEHGYVNVLFNYVIVMRYNTGLKIK